MADRSSSGLLGPKLANGTVADHVRDVMVELLANRQQPGAVVRTWDNPVAAQHAAQDLDLGFEEPDAGVSGSGANFNDEVSKHVKPPQQGV